VFLFFLVANVGIKMKPKGIEKHTCKETKRGWKQKKWTFLGYNNHGRCQDFECLDSNSDIWNKLNLPKMSLAYHAHPHQQIPTLLMHEEGPYAYYIRMGGILHLPNRSTIPSTLRRRHKNTRPVVPSCMD
jgi:hypothetical protein